EQPGSCGQIRQSRGGTMTRRAGGDPAGAKPICKEGEKARITSSGLPGRPRLEDTGASGEVRSHEIDSLRQGLGRTHPQSDREIGKVECPTVTAGVCHQYHPLIQPCRVADELGRWAAQDRDPRLARKPARRACCVLIGERKLDSKEPTGLGETRGVSRQSRSQTNDGDRITVNRELERGGTAPPTAAP